MGVPSGERRRRRRRRSRLPSIVALAAALLAVVAIPVSVTRGGDEDPTPAASATPAALARVRVAPVVAVARGASVTVHYRIEDEAHGVAAARLTVRSGAGTVVKSLRLADRTTNARHTARFCVRFPAGRYTCTVTADGAGGTTDTTPLRVLPAPPPLVPKAAAVDAAVAFLKTRDCRSALAVVDTRGKLRGYNLDVQFTSASVVKAMLMVQYLRTHDEVGESASSLLTSMITVSDNAAAYAIYGEVGEAGLRDLAKDAGMRRFEVGEDVLHSLITASDQARFFWSMDDHLPAVHRDEARWLLSHICDDQTWGVAEVARPAWQVYFKSGWFDEDGISNRLVNQVARLERGKLVWSVAVLTDDNPTTLYCLDTLRGVTAELLEE